MDSVGGTNPTRPGGSEAPMTRVAANHPRRRDRHGDNLRTTRPRLKGRRFLLPVSFRTPNRISNDWRHVSVTPRDQTDPRRRPAPSSGARGLPPVTQPSPGLSKNPAAPSAPGASRTSLPIEPDGAPAQTAHPAPHPHDNPPLRPSRPRSIRARHGRAVRTRRATRITLVAGQSTHAHPLVGRRRLPGDGGWLVSRRRIQLPRPLRPQRP